MKGFTWTWERNAELMLSKDLPISESDRHLSIRQVAGRHTVGWTLAILGFFVLLDIASFTLGQRLAFAGLLSLIYGSTSVKRDEDAWHKNGFDRVTLFGPIKDAAWYRVLAIGEWAAYLVMLVVAASLSVQVVDGL